MRFAFRTDSSPRIGMGHLMRCLTLAKGLKRRGFECYFICRDFDGNGSKHIIDNGFVLELLSVENVDLNATWLGVSVQKDSNETIEVLSESLCDWLIVDHYDIEHEWETLVRRELPDMKMMVIDDLVRQKHNCDVLLDQTYGRSQEAYQKLVPEFTKFCLGGDYALLRSEFRKLRELCLQNAKPKEDPCHILVTLGGGDNAQSIQIIGQALSRLADDHLFSLTLITGDVSDEVLQDYQSLSDRVEYVRFSNNLADEMMKADFVIGAGGGTSWERCCLGLPTVVLTVADNQIEIAKILNEQRAGISVKIDSDEIANAVQLLLMDADLRSQMSKNASDMCDGKGVPRVVATIVASSLEIRKAKLSDAQFIFDARYDGNASQFYRNRDAPSFSSHISWLEKALASDDCQLLCLHLNSEEVAHVRLDKDLSRSDAGEIGICLAKDWRGKGVGLAVLLAANSYFSDLGFLNISAEIHQSNLASENIFKQAGYAYVSTDSQGFMRYLWLA